jgi:hypothetical protein
VSTAGGDGWLRLDHQAWPLDHLAPLDHLTLLDHLVAEPGLRLVGCCNELNTGRVRR